MRASLMGNTRGLYTAPHDPADSGGLQRTPADSSGLRQILPDSGGLQRTHILDCVGVTWANLGFLVQVESAGVRRSPWSLPDSAGLNPDSGGVQCSSGLQWTLPDSSRP